MGGVFAMEEEKKEAFEYVSLLARLIAALIDFVVLLLATVSVLYAIHGEGYFRLDILKRGPIDFLNSVVVPSLVILLFWILCSTTPGKMMIAAKIVDAKTGGKPTIRQFLVRYIGWFVSALFLGIGFLRIPFSPLKQGWHDEFAGTVVVRRPRKR